MWLVTSVCPTSQQFPSTSHKQINGQTLPNLLSPVFAMQSSKSWVSTAKPEDNRFGNVRPSVLPFVSLSVLCVSVISGRMRIIVQMQSIGF